MIYALDIEIASENGFATIGRGAPSQSQITPRRDWTAVLRSG